MLYRHLLLQGERSRGIGYITDGLVFHLDGIDKGNTPGRWDTLIGGVSYELNSHATLESDAVVMDGAGILRDPNGNYVFVDYGVGTIEVCAERLNTSGGIIIYGGTRDLGFMIASKGFTFAVVDSTTARNQWNLTKPMLFTCSANGIICCLNGTVQGTLASNGWSTTLNENTIGGRTRYPYYYSGVQIYSIRKYNRQLTLAEMRNNQQIDNIRFNLGLNI